jgi:hypothetical protein
MERALFIDCSSGRLSEWKILFLGWSPVVVVSVMRTLRFGRKLFWVATSD